MRGRGRLVLSCALLVLAMDGARAAPVASRSRGFACPVTASIAVRGRAHVFRGVLSRSCDAATYSFVAPPRSTLRWTYHGPSVRFLLERPDGDVDGPGITSPVMMTTGGTYRFSLSSNRMGEGIHGRYGIRFVLQ